jgi:hypothetical protein
MFSKYLLATCLLWLNLQSIAQKSAEPKAYYDVNWNPCDPLLARFVTYVTPTDSGHLRMDYYISNSNPQMIAHFSDPEEKIHHGPANYYYPDGKPSALGNYIQNNLHGICLSFHPNGIISDSAVYDHGRIVGYGLGWHSNGMQSDSLFQRNDSVLAAVYWFDDGSPKMAGLYLNGKRHGTWQFFHKGGGLSKKAIFKAGEETSAQYFDQEGKSMTEELEERAAFFKGGEKGWKTYLEKKLYWPTGYQFKDGNQAVVSVKFSIDEEGKVRDAYVDVPFHPEFDKIALKAIKLSEGWQPAIQHNRAVSYNQRQLVTFSQPD